MFYIGGIYYLVFEVVTFLFFVFLLTKKEYILKNYRIFWLLFLIIPLVPELMVYGESIANNNIIRIIPLGMCHISVYLTTFLMFKYNRRLHVVTCILAAGGVISVIMPAPLEGVSLNVMRPYYFYLIHIYIIAANILLAYKYNFTMTIKDYLFGITWAMILCTSFIIISIFTGQDELFFFSGPSGLFTEDVPFGAPRAILAYIVYFSLYSMPYVVHRAYLALKNYESFTNKSI